MSDNENLVRTDLGLADQMNMDNLVRTVVAQMFENDNNIATLEVTLNGTDAPTPPTLEIELRLRAINGQPTEGADNGSGS